MKQYNVTGMHCAACQANVEKAVGAVPGVTSVAVSLLTNSMGVEGTASTEDIVAAVEAAGYGASPQGEPTGGKSSSSVAVPDLRDKETPKLLKRFGWSLGFLLVLMYFSMGAHMWGWPLPSFYDENHVAMGLTQLLLTIVIMIINRDFFISGLRSLWHRTPNMDALVALGSGVSFLYSLWALFAMTRAQVDGGAEAAMEYMDHFYFESAAMILVLITVGKTLEARSKGKTTDALKSLIQLAPKTATVLRQGEEVVLPVEEVALNDVFVVRPGEQIPVDGVVLEGSTAVDESSLTGESIPVEKTEGSNVSAGTINTSGYVQCRATRVGENTTLSQIIKLVSDAAATKAPIAKMADKVAGVFVPAVLCIAALVFVVWMILGQTFEFSLTRGIAVLVISCPCALGLATPVAIMVGNGKGAKNGILFKTAISLEETGKTAAIALDKTGTLTEGSPKVTDLVPGKEQEEELLKLAYLLEQKSEHPLAKAIVEEAQNRNLDEKTSFSLDLLEDFEALPGNGLKGTLKGEPLVGGNLRLMENTLSEEWLPFARETGERLAVEGKTPLFFALGSDLLGVIAVADTLKPESVQAVAELKNMGIHTVMLTGDNEQTANAIAAKVGVDEVVAGVLPADKASVVQNLQHSYGKVTMVGDGINDAPALTVADIGIAIGAGTDVALEAADVVLVNSNPADLPAAVRLSRQTLTNIKENLFWAFFYNVICIPLAAGCYHGLGIDLNPMVGAACMSLSSFCVVMNALRLNLFDLRNPKHDRARATKKGNKAMEEKVITVEGMMCEHCEASVKKALEEIRHVESATPDHNHNKVTLELSGKVKDEKLKKAIEGAGYKFIG